MKNAALVRPPEVIPEWRFAGICGRFQGATAHLWRQCRTDKPFFRALTPSKIGPLVQVREIPRHSAKFHLDF